MGLYVPFCGHGCLAGLSLPCFVALMSCVCYTQCLTSLTVYYISVFLSVSEDCRDRLARFGKTTSGIILFCNSVSRFLLWRRMAGMAVWAAVLISMGIAMDSAEPGLNEILLDMAPNSVDDMYDGCKNQMKKVGKEYLQNERKDNEQFRKAWGEAENKLKPKDKKKKNPPVMWKVAICVYTLVEPNIYLDFNNAVRTQRFEYTTTFRYHALHFFLTDALQILNKNANCFTAYRRVNRSFNQDVLNKEIRFGSFTSGSRVGYPSAKRFGDESCFNISTCSGADISEHSSVKSESEVLIPPYEVFKVTKIERRSDQKSLPCKVVFTVERTGTVSNTNCALVL